jgi:hypothetical protein
VLWSPQVPHSRETTGGAPVSRLGRLEPGIARPKKKSLGEVEHYANTRESPKLLTPPLRKQSKAKAEPS